MTDLAARRAAVLRAMDADGIAALLVAGNGLHLIDLPDPVAHLVGFRSLGEAVAVLRADGTGTLLVAPSADGERAAEQTAAMDCVGTDDLPAALARLGLPERVRWVGLGAMPVRLATALARAAGSRAGWDHRFDQATAAKTARELDDARRATAIAEAGFADLLALAQDGVRSGTMRECDLAIEVNLRMKALGADGSFLMLNALPRSPAIMPSSERLLQPRDMILVELSPSVGGQFVQICRTAMLGEPAAALVADYRLLTEALGAGLDAVRPGVSVSAICDAIDARMAAAGYAAYSRPPHLRRRGHGLGCGSIWPGDVAYDNPVTLEPDMLFVVHPNQLLPDSGYMMCGEPVRVTQAGAEVLSHRRSALAVVEP
jgi:Xaa-Pro aminopeptidase